jgi:lipoprotein-anchoring transpeptidase ErfK/SrfK
VRLYTRYQPSREQRMPTRLIAIGLLLGAALVAWLKYQPAPRDDARQFLQLQPSKPAPTTRATTNLSPLPNPAPATNVAPRSAAPPQPPGRPSLGTRLGGGWTNRPVQNTLEAQIALANLGFSPGSIDGVGGPRTRNALKAFQESQRLATSGDLDPATRRRLILTEYPYTNYVITARDVERLMPIPATWLEKSRLPRLDYENLLELVSEMARAHPDFIQRLNQGTDWTNVAAGTTVLIPNLAPLRVTNKAASARIRLGDHVLRLLDESTNLLAQFPCSIARSVDKRPIGELHVTVLIPFPDYTWDPLNYPQSPEAQKLQSKLILPPGPNNPVGLAWIGLDRAGYGIHGTPWPERVGQAESLGCFRLANWNAEVLLRAAWVGMPVFVDP